jgi:hypothetical protein
LTSDPNWHYVAITYDGVTDQEMKIYIDGTQDQQTTPFPKSNNILSAGKEFWIGHGDHAIEKGWSFPWKGIVDEVRISNIARNECWIQTSYNNQNSPATFISLGSEEGPGLPTAIGLISFAATGVGNDVKVDWETGHEVANLGFNLYRAESPTGPFEKINSALIPGLNYSALGKAYSYVDSDVSPGTLYYYKLEDIDAYGTHTWHGPVCVDWDADGMADDWEIRYGLNPWVNDADIDSDGDGLSNREEYELGFDPFNPDTDGDGILDGEEVGLVEQPDADGSRVLTRGVEVISEDGSGVTLELRTEFFDTQTVEAEGFEFERLRIEEYIHGYTSEMGKPQLPLKGILIDLPEGMTGALSIVETKVQTHAGYQIFPVPEAVVDADGATAAVGESFVFDEVAYAQDAFYPQDVARLASISANRTNSRWCFIR